jgi:PKD repeat protein
MLLILETRQGLMVNLMKIPCKKLLVALMIIMFVITMVFSPVTVIGQETRTIRIISSATGNSSISLGDENKLLPPGGYPFTVNVTLDGLTENLFTFQIGIIFDLTKVKCTAAWIPDKDPNFVFYGKNAQIPSPMIDNIHYGYVMLGASLVDILHPVTVSQGLFCQINFTAIKTGASTLKHITPRLSSDPLYGLETFLWDSNLVDLSFVGQGFSVTVIAFRSPPVASFIFNPQHPRPNQTVTFDASASYDPDGNITSYVWDFGDGKNATTTNTTGVTHLFTLAGVYSVNLTVFDNDGFNNSIVKDVLVGRSPFVSFTYEPTEILNNMVVTFNASASYDPDGNITSYVWDFGDGKNATTTNITLTHVFTKNGVYMVSLTVFDNYGLHNSSVQEIMVGIPPKASFVFAPEFPNPNEAVIFDATDSSAPDSPGGKPVLLIWDFGDYGGELKVNVTDPTNATYFVASHNYAGGGAYPVNLTVYDKDGLHDSMIQVVNVTLTGEAGGAGTDLMTYAIVAIVIIIIVAITVWYKRRPEKEPGRRERYRVI